MRRFAWALALALASGVACTSFGGSTNDKPSAGDSGGKDANASGDDDSSIAQPDASEVDAGVFGGPAQVIDTFEDRSDPLTKGGPLDWNQLGHAPGTFDRNTCDGVVPTGACADTTLRFEAPRQSAGQGVFIGTAITGKPRKIRFDFGMELKGDPDPPLGGSPISQTQLVNIQFSNARNVYLETRGGVLFVGDQYAIDPSDPNSDYRNDETSLAPVDFAWAVYQIYLDLDAGTVTVARQGVVYKSRNIRPQILAEQLMAVRIGTSYTDGLAAIQQLVDNVGLSQFP